MAREPESNDPRPASRRAPLATVVIAAAILGLFGADAKAQPTPALTSPTEVALDRATQTVPLDFSQPVRLRDLQTSLQARDPQGKGVPVFVIPRDTTHFSVRVPVRVGEPLMLQFTRPVAGLAGGALNPPTAIRVRLAAPTAPAAPKEAAYAEPRLFFGVNSNRTRAFTSQLGPWLQQLGAGLIRQGWSMQGLNPNCKPLATADQWDWSAFDAMLENYHRANVRVLLTAMQFAAPACATGGTVNSAFHIYAPQTYADYVEAITRRAITRHPGVVAAIELGNEEDSGSFWKGPPGDPYALRRHDAGAYWAFMKPAAEAIARVRRETGGQVAILNGSYAGSGEDLAWWSSLLSQPGFGSLVDGLDVHVYPWAGADPDQAPGFNDLSMIDREAAAARAAGLGNLPFWISEVSVQTSPHCAWSVDEHEQARLLRGLYARFAGSTAPKVASVVWFTIQDDANDRTAGADETNQPGVCYMVQGLGLIDDVGRKRESFQAYHDLIAAHAR